MVQQCLIAGHKIVVYVSIIHGTRYTIHDLRRFLYRVANSKFQNPSGFFTHIAAMQNKAIFILLIIINF